MRVAFGLALLLLSTSALAEPKWLDVEVNTKRTIEAQQFEDVGLGVLEAPPQAWSEAGIVLTPEEQQRSTLKSTELGLTLVIDEALQKVSIQAPAHRVPVQVLNAKEDRKALDVGPSAKGVLVGYDVAMSTDGKDVFASLGHSVDVHVGHGVVSTTGQLNATSQEGVSYRRGFTTYTRDNPQSLRTVQVGDIATTPNALVAPVMMGGVRVGKDPTLEAAPLFHIPTLGGVATETSHVQAVINGTRSEAFEVLPGGFELNNPALTTGMNTGYFVVKDRFGRESLIDQRFYFSPNSLRKGLSMWSAALGVVRQGTTDRYHTPALSVNYAKGLTNQTTLDVGAEATAKSQNAWIGMRTYGRMGSFQGAWGQSQSDQGQGSAYQLAYSFQTRQGSVGIQHTHQDDQWWQLSQEASQQGPYTSTTLSASKPWGQHWSTTFNVGRYEQDDVVDQRQEMRIDYSRNQHNLSLGVAKTHSDTQWMLTYTRPFGPASGGAEYRQSQKGRSMALRANGDWDTHRGNIDWGMKAGQTMGMNFGSAVARLEAPTYDATVRLDVFGQDPTLSLNYTSGVWIGEDTREDVKTYGQSIAVVKVPGVEGVPVFLENKLVGTTNQEGVLVIGPVRGLEPNHIRIDERKLPLGYEVESAQLSVVPNRKHVALVEFKPRSLQARTFRLTHQGKDVEVGKVLKNTEIMIGYEGMLYLEDPKPEQRFEIEGVCQFSLPKVLPKFEEVLTLSCE